MQGGDLFFCRLFGKRGGGERKVGGVATVKNFETEEERAEAVVSNFRDCWPTNRRKWMKKL